MKRDILGVPYAAVTVEAIVYKTFRYANSSKWTIQKKDEVLKN